MGIPGDVSLSAEDISSNRPPSPPQKEVPAALVDHQEMDDDDEHDEYSEGQHEEEQHGILGGSLAVKFLLAGGVAGAGKRCKQACLAQSDWLYSVKDVYRTL